MKNSNLLVSVTTLMFLISCGGNSVVTAEKTIEKENELDSSKNLSMITDTMRDLNNIEYRCNDHFFEYRNGSVEISKSRRGLEIIRGSKFFFDKESKFLVYQSERDLVVYNLCLAEVVTKFILEKDEKLTNVVSLKNNRFFVVLENASGKVLYEIELDLERLELVEGQLRNFEYKEFVEIR